MSILESRTKKELVDFCKKNDIKGYAKYNKDDLKKYIEEQAVIRGISLEIKPELSGFEVNSPKPGSPKPLVYTNKYLEPGVFFARFEPSDKLGSGTYGTVSKTKLPGFAVKQIQGDSRVPVEPSFITELNFYSMLDHPCIMRLEAWTFRDDSGYIVLPMGTPIKEAVDSGLITLDEVMADMLSAVGFLHQLGIAHLDIKTGNVVFHEGRAKLIDFGLATNATLFSNGRFYIRTVGFTPYYRWPEYVPENWNPIETDLYAVAKTLFDLSPGVDRNNIMLRVYSFRTRNDNINRLIERTAVTRDFLMTTGEIISEVPVVRTWSGVALETPALDVDPNCGRIQSIALDWMLDVATETPYSARTLFLALHLYHRVLRVVIPNYVTNKSQVQLLSISCFYLASVVLSEQIIDFSLWLHLTRNTYNKDQMTDMIIKIMIAANGIIQTPTYWEAANGVEDLVLLLDDTVNCNYTGQGVRRLPGIISSKSISAKKIAREYRKTRKEPKTQEEIWERVIIEAPYSIVGVNSSPEPVQTVRGLEMARTMFKRNDLYSAMNYIMANRSKLPEIDDNLSYYLYSQLRGNLKYGSWDIFHMTVDFNFENAQTALFQANGINPWKASCPDLERLQADVCPRIPDNVFIP